MQRQKITDNFYLDEFLHSDTAIEKGIDNSLPDIVAGVMALHALCTKVLQPARNALGRLDLISGFRREALNTAIDGSDNSQHMDAEAADITSPMHPPLAVAKWLESHTCFDQLIYYPDENFCHVSHTAKRLNRGETLTKITVNGETHYVPGILPRAKAIAFVGG